MVEVNAEEQIPVEQAPEAGGISTALVPALMPEHVGHISQEYRAKVARDLKLHMTAENRWDYSLFEPLNDYQRHLYALFLRLAGVRIQGILAELWKISTDVSVPQRKAYVQDIIYSGIVGIPTLHPREALGVAP